MSKNFALIGAAGYIAPKHMEAIKNCGGTLVAALDKTDSVGIIDTYFPDTSFFTEFERFDRHLEKLKRDGGAIDYLVVCSPNYLHDAHIRFGLRLGADVICEKPMVLNDWNISALEDIQRETGKKVYNILQLRLHENIVDLKRRIEEGPKDKVYDIDLTYQTSRGLWYYTSWKGDNSKSGGIATNIGVHFFDMLSWIFGDLKENIVHLHEHDRAAGYLEFDKARVRWFLSINFDTLAEDLKNKGIRTYRSIKMDGEEIEFSGGFTELHTRSYEDILSGDGFKVHEARKAIQIVQKIRNTEPVGLVGNYHPMANLPLVKHPFTHS